MGSARREAVLIVEDDASLRASLAAAAERRWHLRPYTAGDLPTGQALARQHRPRYGVVDMQLPGGSGIQLIGEMREANREAVLVLISGHGSIDSTVEAMKAGANDVLPKPFTIPEITQRVLFGRPQRACEVAPPFTFERLKWGKSSASTARLDATSPRPRVCSKSTGTP